MDPPGVSADTEVYDSMEHLDEALCSLAAILNSYQRAEIFIADPDPGKIEDMIRKEIRPVPLFSVTVCDSGDGNRYARITAEGYEIPYSYGGWFRSRRCFYEERDGRTVEVRKNLITCGMRHHR